MTLLLEVLQQAISGAGNPEDVDEAGLVASLLIERAQYGSSCEGLVGEPFLSYRPSPDEVREAVGRIIAHAEDVGVPHYRLVHALSRSRDPRAVQTLIRIFEAVLSQPDQEVVELDCVRGVALNAGRVNKQLLERASKSAWPSVRRFAGDFLRQLEAHENDAKDDGQ